MSSKFLRLLAAGFSAVLLMAALGSAKAQCKGNYNGAIFTTLGDGTTVNGNNFTDKCLVYLNGGPQNLNSKGLPNGEYYFQVTDPSGGTLLSSDAISLREVTVTNGAISGAGGAGNHPSGTANAANGSTPVLLCPMADTPNAGGVYKVWLTPVGCYTDGSGTFGFTDSNSKTDNFRVQSANPPPPSGCQINVADYTTCVNAATILGSSLPTPTVTNCTDTAVAILTKTPSVSGTPIDPAIYVFPIGQTVVDWNVVLTNGESGTVSQFVTLNQNPDCTITFDPASASLCVPAGDNLQYAWTGPITGSTTGSCATVAGFGTFGVTVTNSATGCFCTNSFCIKPTTGGGLTLGFWSNKNGIALETSADLTFLTGLCLRKADGSNFDPTTTTQLSQWLLAANATNMANMLSAQLTAMELNVRHGKVDPNAYVYVGCHGYVFVKVGDLITSAAAALCANGYTVASGPDRTLQECLKNALDAANNNLNFVAGGSCP